MMIGLTGSCLKKCLNKHAHFHQTLAKYALKNLEICIYMQFKYANSNFEITKISIFLKITYFDLFKCTGYYMHFIFNYFTLR